jgi:hypothetical protein
MFDDNGYQQLSFQQAVEYVLVMGQRRKWGKWHVSQLKL